METAQFQVIEGHVPILLSAPHAFAHRRPTLNGCYKLGEPYTDTIVKQVRDDTSAFAIYLCNECDYDPNYHREKNNEYKQKVVDLITKNKLERFIDIHGLRDGNDYDVGIYYPTRFTKSLAFAYEVQEKLNRGKLLGISIEIFRFMDNDQETLGEFVASKLRVPSIQIEVTRYIRDNDELRASFIDNLDAVVKKYI